jgi:hypothetical protein
VQHASTVDVMHCQADLSGGGGNARRGQEGHCEIGRGMEHAVDVMHCQAVLGVWLEDGGKRKGGG